MKEKDSVNKEAQATFTDSAISAQSHRNKARSKVKEVSQNSLNITEPWALIMSTRDNYRGFSEYLNA